MTLRRKKGWVGVDEAGRGSIAGPLVAAAVLIPPGFVGTGIRDSKKLSPTKREKFAKMVMQCCNYGMGIVTVEELSEMSLTDATFLAMQRALDDLGTDYTGVLVDGKLKIPTINVPQVTCVGGDDRYLQIAAASILAKYTRDSLMVQYADIFPDYAFEVHKGYPTALHHERLRMYGPCPIHRLCTRPLKDYLNGKEDFGITGDAGGPAPPHSRDLGAS